jgi:hypothetical protein
VSYQGILAILIAMLFTIATTSSATIIPYIYWAFSGITAAVLARGPTIEWEVRPTVKARMRRIGVGLAPILIRPAADSGKMRVIDPR